MSSPIRVAIAGLSASPFAWANISHLPVLQHHPDYELAALITRSSDTAKATIAAHSLPSSIKVFSSTAEAAADASIDLIVISVKLPLHHELALPALKAGKSVYVEWPLASSVAEAEELANAARQNGTKGFVGLQDGLEPTAQTIKKLLDDGKIGDVWSSTVVFNLGNMMNWKQVQEKNSYFIEKGAGGDALSLPAVHLLEAVYTVLGRPDVKKPLQTVLGNVIPSVDIIDEAGNVLKRDHPHNTPDHVLVQGILSSGTVLSLSSTLGNSIDKGLRWNIFGSKGCIEITAQTIPSFDGTRTVIQLKRHGEDAVEIVEVKRPAGAPEQIDGPAMGIWALYDGYAKEGGQYVSFDDAVERHKMVADMRASALV